MDSRRNSKRRSVSRGELDHILRDHESWLDSDRTEGVRAALSRTDLASVDLAGANLSRGDLSGARLARANLSGCDLTSVNLVRADLSWADLSGADLSRADLSASDLSGTDLTGSRLCGAYLPGAALARACLHAADLSQADLTGVDLSRAVLTGARLAGTQLAGADLSNADLSDATLSSADVHRAHFKGVVLARTVIVGVNLGGVRGLEDVEHLAPSSLATDTLTRSSGGIAPAFLKGCGLTEVDIAAAKLAHTGLSAEDVTEIAYNIINLKTAGPLAVGGVFISYAPEDADFIDAVAADLEARGIRHWRNVRGLRPGRMERQIQRFVRPLDYVMLVLSKHSVGHEWVEWEVAEANKLRRSHDRRVLCPVALDEAWKTCDWPGPILRQIKDYKVLDFSEWRAAPVLAHQCEEMIDGLRIFQPASRETGQLSGDRRSSPDTGT